MEEMKKPWVQIAIDAVDLEKAQKLASMAVAAGADWIEAGTPLITFQSVKAIGVLVRACPGKPILADFKAQDGVAKYFKEAGRQGAKIATVLGVVANGSVKAAVREGKESGVQVVADMYSVPREILARRAKELQGLGVDYLMIHLGFDESKDEPGKHATDGLEEVVEAVQIPVGVGTFTVEEAVEAIRKGASFVVQGEPLLSDANAEKKLRDFIEAVRSAV
ncbi:MAG: orotidine 5'-phosphate decarboxylase / HUMPS family protein [Spirochaetia bacterium]|jgi:3-keto-L-gulonate-6-phosphate decarboxylase